MAPQRVLPHPAAEHDPLLDDPIEQPRSYPTPEELRAACAQFATGVVVVTATADGSDHGGTVNSFTSLSLDPPQVVVCLARTSNTWSAIERSGAFAVNVLAADQLAHARLFASKEPDKMSQVDSPPGVLGTPLLTGALSHIECRLAQAIPSGTHLVLIGRVVRVGSETSKGPALFFRSQLMEALPHQLEPLAHAEAPAAMLPAQPARGR